MVDLPPRKATARQVVESYFIWSDARRLPSRSLDVGWSCPAIHAAAVQSPIISVRLADRWGLSGSQNEVEPAWTTPYNSSPMAEAEKTKLRLEDRLFHRRDTVRGETDKAFESLQISFNNHDAGMVSPLTDPLLRGLRDDRRHKNLLQKRGSPEVL